MRRCGPGYCKLQSSNGFSHHDLRCPQVLYNLEHAIDLVNRAEADMPRADVLVRQLAALEYDHMPSEVSFGFIVLRCSNQNLPRIYQGFLV